MFAAHLLRSRLGKDIPESEGFVSGAGDNGLPVRTHGQVEDPVRVAGQLRDLNQARVFPDENLKCKKVQVDGFLSSFSSKTFWPKVTRWPIQVSISTGGTEAEGSKALLGRENKLKPKDPRLAADPGNLNFFGLHGLERSG